MGPHIALAVVVCATARVRPSTSTPYSAKQLAKAPNAASRMRKVGKHSTRHVMARPLYY